MPGTLRRRLAERDGGQHEGRGAGHAGARLHARADREPLRALVRRVRIARAEVRRRQRAGVDPARPRAPRRRAVGASEVAQARGGAAIEERRSGSRTRARARERNDLMNPSTDWTSALAILAAGLILGALGWLIARRRKASVATTRYELEARRDGLLQQL